MQRQPNDVSSETVGSGRLPLCSYSLDAFRERGSLGGVLCPMLCYWKSRGHAGGLSKLGKLPPTMLPNKDCSTM